MVIFYCRMIISCSFLQLFSEIFESYVNMARGYEEEDHNLLLVSAPPHLSAKANRYSI